LSARQQFAGWGYYDHVAICLHCKTEHLIPKAEQVSNQPWYDWLHKHRFCGGDETVFILPHSLRSALGEKLAQIPLRENANVKAEYAASAAYTITLTSLASGSTLLAGREGNSLSNATNKYLDELVSARITTGTTPTAGVIEVHIVGSQDDTPTWPDVFDGTDSTETVTSADIKASICAQVGGVINSTSSNIAYDFRPVGIRQFFGDAMPPSHVPFVTHSTVAALNATATNHFIKHTPVYATVA
jgi:flagellar hook-associated protein FlgK